MASLGGGGRYGDPYSYDARKNRAIVEAAQKEYDKLVGEMRAPGYAGKKQNVGQTEDLFRLSELITTLIREGHQNIEFEQTPIALILESINDNGGAGIKDCAIKLLLIFAKLAKIGFLPAYSTRGDNDAHDDILAIANQAIELVKSNLTTFSTADKIDVLYALSIFYPDSITEVFFEVWKDGFFNEFNKEPEEGLTLKYIKLFHGLTNIVINLKSDENQNFKEMVTGFVVGMYNRYKNDIYQKLNYQSLHLKNQISQSALVFDILTRFNFKLQEIDIDESLYQHKFADALRVGLKEAEIYEVREEYIHIDGVSPVDIAIFKKGSNAPILCIEIDGQANHKATRMCSVGDRQRIVLTKRPIDQQKEQEFNALGIPIWHIKNWDLFSNIYAAYFGRKPIAIALGKSVEAFERKIGLHTRQRPPMPRRSQSAPPIKNHLDVPAADASYAHTPPDRAETPDNSEIRELLRHIKGITVGCDYKPVRGAHTERVASNDTEGKQWP